MKKTVVSVKLNDDELAFLDKEVNRLASLSAAAMVSRGSVLRGLVRDAKTKSFNDIAQKKALTDTIKGATFGGTLTIGQEPDFFRRLRALIVKYGNRTVRIVLTQIEGTETKQTPNQSRVIVHEVTEIQGRAPDEICAEIEDAIQNESANFPGIVRYEIVALHKEGFVLGGRIVLERRRKAA